MKYPTFHNENVLFTIAHYLTAFIIIPAMIAYVWLSEIKRADIVFITSILITINALLLMLLPNLNCLKRKKNTQTVKLHYLRETTGVIKTACVEKHMLNNLDEISELIVIVGYLEKLIPIKLHKNKQPLIFRLVLEKVKTILDLLEDGVEDSELFYNHVKIDLKNNFTNNIEVTILESETDIKKIQLNIKHRAQP